MTNRFLISAAAIALIASGGFANAQGTGMRSKARHPVVIRRRLPIDMLRNPPGPGPA